MYEFSKSQKKVARQLIDKGLQIECGQCLNQVKSLLSKSEGNGLSNHETYLKLYRLIHGFDKQFGRRYDNLTGSRYFMTVLGLYRDDVITDEDLDDFDEETRNKLIGLKKSFG
jgi:bacterioferritin-associated ferredoxin